MNNADNVLPQPQQTQDQPVVHRKWFTSLKSLQSRKLLTLLAAVLVIVIIAGISMGITHPSYYQLPQTAPPSDWKIYTSSTFPYTFEYPPAWKLEVNFQTGDYDEIFLSSPDFKFTPPNNVISGTAITLEVSPTTSPDLADLYDSITVYIGGNASGSYKVYSKQYTYLNGIKALRLDIDRGDMVFAGRGILVATIRNSKVYIFKFSQKDVDHLAVFDQVLSTFKFTD